MQYVFVYSVITLSLLSSLIFLIKLKLIRNKNILIFGAYLLLCGIFEIIAWVNISGGNEFGQRIYQILEFAILGFFFLTLLKLDRSKFFILGLGIAYLIADVFILKPLEIANLYSKSIIDIFYIASSIAVLFLLINKALEIVQSESIKFFNFGLLIKYTGGFIMYLCFQIILGFSTELQRNIWYTVFCMNITAQILFIIGLLKLKKADDRD